MPKLIITEESAKVILRIIDTWSGKLTWELLCEKIAAALDVDSIQRQSLAAYVEIQQHYTKKKEELRNEKQQIPPAGDVSVAFLQKQVRDLKSEVIKLRAVNQNHQERFIRWQYNAYLHGVRISSLDDAVEVLDKPLIAVNRSKGG